MKAAIQAIYWELLWKNKLVFSALGVLFGVGAGSAWVAAHGTLGPEWSVQVRSIVITVFFISILIAYAPFTLMESAGGWKMNSMVTRWFVLPVRTVYLVVFPLVAACAVISAVVFLWLPVLNRITSGFDAFYFVSVLMVTQIAINALSWTVPRKPLQFWAGVGLLFPLVFVLAIGPMDQPGKEPFRHGLLVPLALFGLSLCGFNLFAANRNRSGAWPGELPFDRFRQWCFPASQVEDRPFGSRQMAMFQSYSLPVVRLHIGSWMALGLTLFLWASLQMRERLPQLAFGLRLIVLLSVDILPGFAVIWMAGLSLFGAGEPSDLFRSRLSAFRAAQPVNGGALAGQRLLMLFVCWLAVWVPLIGLSYFHREGLLGIPMEPIQQGQAALARSAAVGAFVAVGALPFLLWGRCDGFPNFLLASVCAWACAWVLVSSLSLGRGEEPGSRWALLVGLLILKFGSAFAGFCFGLCRRQITWRFPAAVLAGWAVVAGALTWTTWSSGLWQTLWIAQMVPLARLAWCPVAVSANRHRN